MAIPAGSCPDVGIAGLALGGGAGYSGASARARPSTTLRRLKLVTADGSLARLRRMHHADLFWASRGGGGGNFGIVDRASTFATHPVSNVAVYSLEWPWAQAAAAVAAWQAFAPHAPDALFSVCDLIATDPSLPNARAHVTSAGQFFGSESDLRALLAAAREHRHADPRCTTTHATRPSRRSSTGAAGELQDRVRRGGPTT